MKILIRKEYKNADYGADVVCIKTLPFAIGSMVCEDLNRFPQPNEKIYLGKSTRHHYPSDVIVCQSNHFIEQKINFAYNCSIEELAKELNENLNDLYAYESDARNELAGKYADEFLVKKN